VADAEYFMEDYSPAVTFVLHSRGTTSEPITVGINFSQGKEEMDRYDSEDSGWQCREVCFPPLPCNPVSDPDFLLIFHKVLGHELPASAQVLQVLRTTAA
jgi:hypothetical protein